MKINSYEATGYKFGLISNPESSILIENDLKAILNSNQENKGKKDIEVKNSISIESIVPFESVDGLTISDLKDYYNLLYEGRYLVFVMYDFIVIRTQPKDAYVRYLYAIDTQENKDCSIDEVVEKHLIETLSKLSLQNRKRALGFLEKYIYSDFRTIQMVISNYIKKIYEDNRSLMPPYISEYIKIPERLINKK